MGIDDRDDGLTDDERAFARALSRTDAGTGPSPALDAAILAMARSAVSEPVARADAMATAAIATPSFPRGQSRHHRRRPNLRLATGLGIAASMVFAIGIAWQLRPAQDEQMSASEAPADSAAPAAMILSPPPPPEMARPVPAPGIAQPEPGADRAMADDAAAGAGASERAAVDAAAAQAQRARIAETESSAAAQARDVAEARESAASNAAARSARIAAPAEPPVVFDEPSPVDTPAPPVSAPAPPPPAPPAPAAARALEPAPASSAAPAPAPALGASAPKPQAFPGQPAPAPASAPAQAAEAERRVQLRRVEESSKQSTLQAPAKSRREADAPRADQVTVTGSRVQQDEDAQTLDAIHVADGYHDEPLDEAPPATVDSPDVQQAWLSRIRELLADGQVDAARDSAAEFRRRYPDVKLPADIARAIE